MVMFITVIPVIFLSINSTCLIVVKPSDFISDKSKFDVF